MNVLAGFFGMLWFVVRTTFLLLGLVLRGGWKTGRWALRRRSTTFGSARWAGFRDVFFGGAWGGPKGLIAGRAYGRFLRYRGEGALLCFAPQGSGKGVGIVVPNLLDHPGSVIVTDVKGENAAVTARYRATLGPVYRLDVSNPASSDCFNPLDMIAVGSDLEAEDTAAVADMLVTPESFEGHWDTSARAVIAMTIGFVLRSEPPERRTLSTVREILASDEHTLAHLLRKMARLPNATIAEQARRVLASLDSPETQSVLNNAAKAMLIWSRDRVAGRLSAESDFDLMDLHAGTITVYVMIPENLLTVFAPFLRVVMGCAMTALLRAKALPKPEHPPLLLLDECAALRRLEALEAGVGYLRSYARMIMVFQDLGQIAQHYGEHGARTIVAASGAQVAFRVSDNATAQELATTVGMRTVASASTGLSYSGTALAHTGQQAGLAEAQRYLIDPAEVRRMKDNRAIVTFSTVKAPIYARKVRHFTERCWAGQWDTWRAPARLPSGVPALRLVSGPTRSDAA